MSVMYIESVCNGKIKKKNEILKKRKKDEALNS